MPIQDVIGNEKASVPTAADYQRAIDSQSACNLSGIVKSLARDLDKIWEEARALNKGTNYVNTHPICRLYAEQIMFLSCGGQPQHESWEQAMRTCDEKVKVQS